MGVLLHDVVGLLLNAGAAPEQAKVKRLPAWRQGLCEPVPHSLARAQTCKMSFSRLPSLLYLRWACGMSGTKSGEREGLYPG